MNLLYIIILFLSSLLVVAIIIATVGSRCSLLGCLRFAAISCSCCWVFVLAIDVPAICVATVFVAATTLLSPMLLLVAVVVAVVAATLAVIGAVGRWHYSCSWILWNSDP